jgi:hypothetical protein
MLERQQYRAFLEEFVAPEDRPRFDREGGLDKIAVEFAKGKAQRLLAMLRAVQHKAPRREDNRAIYEGDEDSPKDLVWVLENGAWYIKN